MYETMQYWFMVKKIVSDIKNDPAFVHKLSYEEDDPNLNFVKPLPPTAFREYLDDLIDEAREHITQNPLFPHNELATDLSYLAEGNHFQEFAEDLLEVKRNYDASLDKARSNPLDLGNQLQLFWETLQYDSEVSLIQSNHSIEHEPDETHFPGYDAVTKQLSKKAVAEGTRGTMLEALRSMADSTAEERHRYYIDFEAGQRAYVSGQPNPFSEEQIDLLLDHYEKVREVTVQHKEHMEESPYVDLRGVMPAIKKALRRAVRNYEIRGMNKETTRQLKRLKPAYQPT